jgi:hypothetical protein
MTGHSPHLQLSTLPILNVSVVMVSRFHSVQAFFWVSRLAASGLGEFRVPNWGLQARLVSQNNLNAAGASNRSFRSGILRLMVPSLRGRPRPLLGPGGGGGS